jgi:hypothetical protein
MAEKPLPRRAREPFGNGPTLLVIGNVVGHANVSSLPIPIEAAA